MGALGCRVYGVILGYVCGDYKAVLGLLPCLSIPTSVSARTAGMDLSSMGTVSRFPSNPLIMRVPFFLMFSFNKETPK